MNWNSISFDWNQARAFLAVAEEHSLSAAAEVLGVTQPTITRQIAALEKELRVVLFERTGRSVSLTPVGLTLLEHVRTMAGGANMVSLAASGQAEDIEGLVRISAADMTAAYILPPILDQLKDIAPKLELEILAENKLSDLLLREADIALRHARPEQPDLFAKLVCEDTARFYAVAKYTENFGQPRLKDDPSHHQFVSFGDVEGMLGHLTALGLTLTKQNFRYASQSQIVEWEIARHGHGIAIMTDRIACKFSDFQPVLTEIEPFTISTWLVAHRELQSSKRIRLVFDLIAESLSP
ncbi:LysR family transcriptional regulator [Cognatiyoonia sp. IB215182]|uniref:LysR family transcriptional regulator n=1 Tax=Cognatiyoonia sp. IB215182 TaxID=3097353 RepID=UPI002A0CEE9C|nr:LysR family transcriptional regulator [Cognatiyoonia sp. IB215182]MDX8354722.1 LysR family transcriptional regulator [Cognatiyoonia sp. IB215182]